MPILRIFAQIGGRSLAITAVCCALLAAWLLMQFGQMAPILARDPHRRRKSLKQPVISA